MKNSHVGGHAPAHALPRAERTTFKKILNRRQPKRHAAHDRARTAEASGVRRAWTTLRQRPVRVNQAPRITEFANLLVIRESVWQRGARMARTPACAVAAAAYLACAWVVVGATASPSPADGPSTAHNADINPRTPPTAVSGGTPSAQRAEESGGGPPEVSIDPQFFKGLEKVISDIDEQRDHDQLTSRQQEVDEPAPPVDHTDAPASDTSLPEPSAIAPPPPEIANPNGQTADAPASDTSLPEPSAIAPPPPEVANPNGLTTDSTSQQPLGPLPGPAA